MTVAASPLDIPAEVKRERRTLSLAQKFAIAFLGLVAAVLIINGAIDMGITYRDDCTRVDIIYRREDTVIGRLGPTESLAIRLTLATLGGPLYAN